MRSIFPPWTNKLRVLLAAGALGGGLYLVTVVSLGFSPDAVNTGYRPEQPVPFSHALHNGELGLDCRYCHNTVDRASHAAIPSTETCMACHTRIRPDSRKLAPVRESWATGKSVEWRRVHDLGDYAYFDHSAHVLGGVACVSCHGRIDQMEVVYQQEPLSMGWCLDCHRNPVPNLRPPHMVTVMEPIDPTDPEVTAFRDKAVDNASQDCSTCHR